MSSECVIYNAHKFVYPLSSQQSLREQLNMVLAAKSAGASADALAAAAAAGFTAAAATGGNNGSVVGGSGGTSATSPSNINPFMFLNLPFPFDSRGLTAFTNPTALTAAAAAAMAVNGFNTNLLTTAAAAAAANANSPSSSPAHHPTNKDNTEHCSINPSDSNSKHCNNNGNTGKQQQSQQQQDLAHVALAFSSAAAAAAANNHLNSHHNMRVSPKSQVSPSSTASSARSSPSAPGLTNGNSVHRNGNTGGHGLSSHSPGLNLKRNFTDDTRSNVSCLPCNQHSSPCVTVIEYYLIQS